MSADVTELIPTVPKIRVKPQKGLGAYGFVYANGEIVGRGYVYYWGRNKNYVPHKKPLIRNGRKPR
ncbi:hypothetical protein [Arthrobacter sp. C152]